MLATPSLLMYKEQCLIFTRSETPGLQASPGRSNRPALVNSGCFVWGFAKNGVRAPPYRK
jgi:hypothetical protein